MVDDQHLAVRAHRFGLILAHVQEPAVVVQNQLPGRELAHHGHVEVLRAVRFVDDNVGVRVPGPSVVARAHQRDTRAVVQVVVGDLVVARPHGRDARSSRCLPEDAQQVPVLQPDDVRERGVMSRALVYRYVFHSRQSLSNVQVSCKPKARSQIPHLSGLAAPTSAPTSFAVGAIRCGILRLCSS